MNLTPPRRPASDPNWDNVPGGAWGDTDIKDPPPSSSDKRPIVTACWDDADDQRSHDVRVGAFDPNEDA